MDGGVVCPLSRVRGWAWHTHARTLACQHTHTLHPPTCAREKASAGAVGSCLGASAAQLRSSAAAPEGSSGSMGSTGG